MLHLLEYLKFLFTATNRHGVHSPFVYGFITECLYSKSSFHGSKTEKVLLKCIANRDIETVYLSDAKAAIKKKIADLFPQCRFDAMRYDLAYFDITEFDLAFPPVTDTIKNETVVIIDSIHKNSLNLARWNRLKKRNAFKVTLDLFYCGVVFLRPQQVKEHFKIRI